MAENKIGQRYGEFVQVALATAFAVACMLVLILIVGSLGAVVVWLLRLLWRGWLGI